MNINNYMEYGNLQTSSGKVCIQYITQYVVFIHFMSFHNHLWYLLLLYTSKHWLFIRHVEKMSFISLSYSIHCINVIPIFFCVNNYHT